MAVVAMLAAFVSSSDASSGGVGVGDETTESCAGGDFGERTMRLGDCGGDVKTLNWLLSSKRVAREAPLGKTFERATEAGVAGFQENRGLETTGVADERTSNRLGRSMQRDLATWYGPGFYGNKTACDQRLRRATVGVAHRSLPCGTKVTISYEDRYLRAPVLDRGPYANGARWDLTGAAAKQLGFTFTDKIRTARVR